MSQRVRGRSLSDRPGRNPVTTGGGVILQGSRNCVITGYDINGGLTPRPRLLKGPESCLRLLGDIIRPYRLGNRQRLDETRLGQAGIAQDDQAYRSPGSGGSPPRDTVALSCVQTAR
jgi:hypothetical protein